MHPVVIGTKEEPVKDSDEADFRQCVEKHLQAPKSIWPLTLFVLILGTQACLLPL